ncbi:MAG: hypothetical protein K1060chlam5_00247, partial [Candidatus Anoxychlamydiales bacterium]|nr:hypothetical protein [Candidatus Anoxychlamydiales bacterium]
AKEYLGLKLARIASDAASSVNNAAEKRKALWEQVLKAREEHAKTAKVQSSKAWPHALSASISIITSVAAAAIANNNDLKNWESALKAIPGISSSASGIWTTKKDGDETTHRAKANEFEATQQMQRNELSNDDSMIQRIFDAFTRSISSLNNI